MPTIDLGYGKANLSDMLATYASLKVTAPFTRVTGINSGKQMTGSTSSIPVGRFDMNGALLNAKVEHPNGTILLIQTSWKRNGIGIRDAALFFRLREGAPLYDVRARVPVGRDNICGDSFQMFSGYADLLTPGELKLFDIEPHRNWAQSFLNAEEIAECFIVTQLRAETIRRPVLQAIATSEGVQMKEIPQAPSRRLNLRKR